MSRRFTADGKISVIQEKRNYSDSSGDVRSRRGEKNRERGWKLMRPERASADESSRFPPVLAPSLTPPEAAGRSGALMSASAFGSRPLWRWNHRIRMWRNVAAARPEALFLFLDLVQVCVRGRSLCRNLEFTSFCLPHVTWAGVGRPGARPLRGEETRVYAKKTAPEERRLQKKRRRASPLNRDAPHLDSRGKNDG